MTLLSVLAEKKTPLVMDVHFPDYRYEKLMAPKNSLSTQMTVNLSIPPREKTQTAALSLLSPLNTISDNHSASDSLSFCFRKKKSVTCHLGNGQTDGKSLWFGLVSDQAAINQRAEAYSEGHRREDKRCE